MRITTLNAIAHGIAASPVMALPVVGPARIPADKGPSLADQNWARNYIADYTVEATRRPNWKIPQAVREQLAEAHKIVAEADRLAVVEKADAAVKAHALSGWYGLS